MNRYGYDLDEAPVVVTAPRWKVAGAGVGSIGFVALGVWLVEQGDLERIVVGSLCIAFFGLLTLRGVGLFIRPARLELSADGLRSSSLGRSVLFPWAALSNVRVVKYRHLSLVGFDLAIDHSFPARSRRLAQQFYGADAVLTGAWPLEASDLAALVAAGRAKWRGD